MRIMYLAKHACGTGVPDPRDGNHAIYHHELRETLKTLGLNVFAANSYDVLHEAPPVDFVLPLLNRGGFQNSEMLAPLLLERHGKPYLGSSAILRGIADDKHAAKMTALHAGVPTMDWQVYRRGGQSIERPHFRPDRYVVKPNASSASWGLFVGASWSDAETHVRTLLAQGHDVIVEAWQPEYDIGVPVIGGADGGPVILPPLRYRPPRGKVYRSYEDKRGLSRAGEEDDLRPVAAPSLRAELERLTLMVAREFWPFDYGRFEYRHDSRTGELRFMEVNLSCNLWSKKTIARSAASVGIEYPRLIEGILGHSLARQGLLTPRREYLAA